MDEGDEALALTAQDALASGRWVPLEPTNVERYLAA
jgi:hypothetical protein